MGRPPQLLPRHRINLQWDVRHSYYRGTELIPHLRVWRRDGKDGITWDELQAVKTEAFGPDVRCIEIYPPEREVVDELNMRHLFAIPDDVRLPNLLPR
jgi:hypothetical protein